MKNLIRDYLASLREREELDAILPDMLSELGFTVISRPQRGTRQNGVDIAAVGNDNDERKLFLFSVKKGDLNRQEWDGTPQALRSSLDEIQDAYIRNRIPEELKSLKIVICLAFGGDVQEQVRELLTGYIAKNTTEQISFEEWNGDTLAGMILKGILREKVLPKNLRSNFRKAVAMVDEPDVSYQHFARLAHELHKVGSESDKARLRAVRQLNICLWILFVWARDVDNLEAPYRISELVLLSVWELLRPIIGINSRELKALDQALHQVIHLHLIIALTFIELKILPYSSIRYGVSLAINSQNSLDVNLALFDMLGRIGLTGVWLHWLGLQSNQENQENIRNRLLRLFHAGQELIRNNPGLRLPITDRQGTDIALFLQLWLVSEDNDSNPRVTSWLKEMAHGLKFSLLRREHYPSCSSDYRALAEHPRDRSDEYFQESTAASTLIPLIAAWLQALGQETEVKMLRELVRSELQHCTLQLWTPNAESETMMYVGGSNHGLALCDLPLDDGGPQLLATIAGACRTDTALKNLSPMLTGVWPVILVACRHHHLPIPPGFWIESLIPTTTSPDEMGSV
ncbi:MAG: chemotaxis protein [Magnetococcales bacterium]|nr:chemotaxis protein [Magnetococcales bacterium]